MSKWMIGWSLLSLLFHGDYFGNLAQSGVGLGVGQFAVEVCIELPKQRLDLLLVDVLVNAQDELAEWGNIEHIVPIQPFWLEQSWDVDVLGFDKSFEFGQDLESFLAGEQFRARLAAFLCFNVHFGQIHSSHPALILGKQLHEVLDNHSALVVGYEFVEEDYFFWSYLFINEAH